MYLQKIKLENIKCFEGLELDFVQGRDTPRLMTVVLGDNGVGKTSLLQAIAITLRGGKEGYTSITDRWVRVEHQQGYIDATISPGIGDESSPKRNLQVSYLVTGEEAVEIEENFYDQSTISALPGKDLATLRRTAYADNTQGWLACGYGPLRGFTKRQTYEIRDTKISRFASLFGRNDDLISVEDWLIELDRRAWIEKREGNDTDYYRNLFNKLTATLLRMLPEEHSLTVVTVGDNSHIASQIKTTSEEGVLWLDSFGNWVKLSQFSDGHQSTMSWTGDLVSRLSNAFSQEEHFLFREGIVLIDEVDIHLHPTWQRKILNQLRHTFPNIQFIVTTHSPLVAASANEGELFVLKKEQDHVVLEPGTSVQGWRADQILTSPLFGLETTRAPETERQLARYDELLAQKAGGQLDATAAQELAELEESLRETLPPPGETPEQRDLQQQMEDFIKQTLSQNCLTGRC